MKCPACNESGVKVWRSTPEPGYAVRRERLCVKCGHRFYTLERLVEDGAMVPAAAPAAPAKPEGKSLEEKKPRSLDIRRLLDCRLVPNFTGCPHIVFNTETREYTVKEYKAKRKDV